MTEELAAVLAYEDVRLSELRGRFAAVDAAVEDALRREMHVAIGIQNLNAELAAVEARLADLGEPVEVTSPARPPVTSLQETPPPPNQTSSATGQNGFHELAEAAGRHLASMGIDAGRDPLLQVLPTGRVLDALHVHAERYGETAWTARDWLIVATAGCVASAIDIFVVGTPHRSHLLGHRVDRGPLTATLKDSKAAEALTTAIEHSGLEARVHAGYDPSTPAALGIDYREFTPTIHRSRSFGHDPSPIGAAVGILDLWTGGGRLAGPDRRVIERVNAMDGVDFWVAALKYLGHLASDVGTPAGLPPPLFTLLALVPADAPFCLPGRDVPDDVAEVARWMFQRGYDLRHCAASGLVAGAVELIVRGYLMLDARETGVQASPAKLASMLLVAHSIVLAGMWVKFVAYADDPTSINWAQLLVMPPAVLSWINAAATLDETIDRDLAERWRELAIAAS